MKKLLLAVVACAAMVGFGNYVQEWRGLPAGYTQVEYIESTGSQYIDTGIVPTTSTAVDFTFNLVKSVNTKAFFGQTWSTSSTPGHYLFSQRDSSGSKFFFYGAGALAGDLSSSYGAVIAGNDYRCQIEPTSNNEGTLTLTWGGVTRSGTVKLAVEANTPLRIFGSAGSTSYLSTIRVYGMKIWTDGVLVADLVPATDGDGKGGLYNLVGDSDNWKANGSTTPFTVGAAVPNPAPAGFTPMLTATGARRIYRAGSYEVYEWTKLGDGNGFTVPGGGVKADILLVGGGGAGGMTRGGGGGGGGVVLANSQDLSAGSYAVTVGAGGIPQYDAKAYQSKDNNGETYNKGKTPNTATGGNSSVSNGDGFELVALGGGGGGCFNSGTSATVLENNSGLVGGSGGGAGGHNGNAVVGGTGTAGQGFAGADNVVPSSGGGGGGGAGGIGILPNSMTAGDGGSGKVVDITGEPICYGGGGGGGGYSVAAGTGGIGGGGAGNYSTHGPLLAQNGVDGLGGGGGGGGGKSNNGWYGVGGVGGSGTVVVRVLLPGNLDVDVQVDNAKAREVEVVACVNVSDGQSTDTFDVYAAIGSSAEESDGFVLIAEGAALNADAAKIFDGLDADTEYCVAVKAQNRNTGKWSDVVKKFVTTSPVAAPVVACGPGIVKTATGYDISLVVSYFQDGATDCTATLNGEAKTITEIGTYVWQVAASGDGCTASIDLSYSVSGVNYDETFTGSVSGKGSLFAVESLMGHDAASTAFVLEAGDRVSLPPLHGHAQYRNLSGHRFLKLDDSTIMALEAGIGAVEQYDASGALVATAVFLIRPDMQEGGKTFVFDYGKSSNGKWDDTGAWYCVETGDYTLMPDSVKDVAFVIIPSTKKAFYLKKTGVSTVQDIYFGRPVNVKGETVRVTGPGTLTVAGIQTKTYSRPGKFMICSCLDNDQWWEFYVTPYNTSEKWKLDVSDNDVELDLGGPTDKFYATKNSKANQVLLRFDKYVEISIAKGHKFSLVNGSDRSGGRGDGQLGNDAFYYLTSSGSVSGKGAFEFALSGVVNYGGNFFSEFEGEILSSVRNFVTGYTGRDGAAFASESGNFVSDHATLTLAGYVNAFNLANSVGTFGHGCNHGTGSPGSQNGNGIPYSGITMNGGFMKFNKYSKTKTNFKPTTYAGADDYEALDETAKLTLAGGLSAIHMDLPDSSNPILHFHAEDIVHENSSSFYVYDNRTIKNSTDPRQLVELDGLSKYYVGNTETIDEASNIFPIVPWMVTRYSDTSSVSDLWWAHVGEDNIMCRGGSGSRNSVALSDVSNPLVNAYCKDKGVALTADVTVNSLMIEGGGKTKELGAERTLTITSGGLIIRSDNNGIGSATGGENNGSLVFPNRAYVWATSTSDSSPDVIWSPITAPYGFCAAGCGQLRIGGDQTGIDGDITVNNGTLQLGDTSGHGCTLDVPINLVGGNTTLVVNQQKTLDNVTLNLACPGGYGPKITVPAAGERCRKVYVDGVSLPRGVYGAFGSGAPLESEFIADGSGYLTVRQDDNAVGFSIFVK